ncbi:MAG: type II secretion system F family protein [Acidobacteria bacterium]|nr:type II secretion system F family protein [Acidobacteriota bacterium]MBI3423689.1 type II secretion system F family protein [Acidobacteriota bacterium]
MLPFFVFIFCLCATYGTYLLVTRKTAEDQERMEKRMREVLLGLDSSSGGPGGAGLDVNQIRLARDEILSEIPKFDEILRKIEFVKWVKQMIDQSDLQLTVMRLFMFCGLAGLLGMMAVSMLANSFLAAILAGVVAACLPMVHVLWKRKKRLDKFLTDLPDTLELMSRALASGHAFTEALHMISKEMPDPIATEFRRTYEEQNLGLSVKIALENLVERVPVLDLKICVTAIMIQRETGGNLAEVLEKVASTIRDRFKILEDLNTLTTSSRMSANVLCAMPAFIALMVSYINPTYMRVLWTEPLGHKLLMAAAALQLTGMIVIRRIMQIKI